MKTIITCGHPQSGYADIHHALQQAGISPAAPSRREQMAVSELHQRILRAAGNADTPPQQSIEPGKIWQELAIDLFLGNMDSPQWGWADERSTWLLEFWKNLDPQVHFVLVYASPAQTLARMLDGLGPYDAQTLKQRLQDYQHYNNQLLHFYSRNPQRCQLVEQQAAQQNMAGLLQTLQTQWGLQLAEAGQASAKEATPGNNAVAQLVAQQLLQQQPQLHSLYAELQSTASLPAPTAKPASDGADKQLAALLTSYTALNSHAPALKQLQQAHTTLQEEKAQLQDGQAQMQQQLVALQEELQTANAAHQQALQQQDLQQENELLLQQLHQVQEELERQFQQKQQLSTQLEQAKTQASQAPAPSASNTELEEENELLLQQLHLVQEELESYFLKHQSTQQELQTIQQQLQAPPLSQIYWAQHHPAEVIVDLREAVQGDNWYAPELDGSWAGPGLVSSIRLPALRPAKYEILFDVVDAMNPAIIEGVSLHLNDHPLELHKDIHDKAALIRTKLDSSQLPPSNEWQLRLDFPQSISPATAHGSDDQRQLTLRLKTIKFKTVN